MKDIYVVTGATGGMGEDIAKAFDEKGTLLLVDLDEEKLKNLRDKLKTKGINAKCAVCDISKKSSVKKLVAKVKEIGKFKALIHTAGISESMGTPERILEVNLIGTKLLMDEFYKIADNSVILNISSMTGHMVPDSFLYNNLLMDPLDKKFMSKIKMFLQNSGTNAYAFSKKGVILLTEKEVDRWAKKKSRILSISPGAIETPLSKKEASENPAVEFMVSKTPIPRFGKPKEITDLVYFLVSKEAEFINGTDVLIDGGITSYMKYNDIFGIKKNKVNKLFPTLIYLLLFFIIPLIFKDFKLDLLLLINPLIVIITTALFTKQKTSLFLTFLPVLLFSISVFIFYNSTALIYALVYGGFSFITTFITKVIKIRKEK